MVGLNFECENNYFSLGVYENKIASVYRPILIIKNTIMFIKDRGRMRRSRSNIILKSVHDFYRSVKLREKIIKRAEN